VWLDVPWGRPYNSRSPHERAVENNIDKATTALAGWANPNEGVTA
jgi:hypothetical protein